MLPRRPTDDCVGVSTEDTSFVVREPNVMHQEFESLLSRRDALERKHRQLCEGCEELGDADVHGRQRRDETYGELRAIQALIDTEIGCNLPPGASSRPCLTWCRPRRSQSDRVRWSRLHDAIQQV
jgi:hypothetical protein